MGKVYLVGAGCGDLDLYTLKAINCIENADCIIYDSLIDETILDRCKKDCEKIYVGKRAGNHAYEQDTINQLLVDQALKYNSVVRLKGGDVYVFGRGGEEGQKLYENHVPFEVVPGISSAIAGLAYAGIPITQRGIATSFHVYTGTSQKNKTTELDFSSMLDEKGTYVFLMSIGKLQYIVQGLLDANKDKNTPVAVISKASFASQKVLTGTLENIVERFQLDPLPTPGIIVIGKVVNMREYLNFYETKPLFGKKILVGVVGDDHSLKDELRQYGADVTEVKTGEIEYLYPKLPKVEGYLIFTSKNGVIGYMEAFLQQYHDLRLLSNATIMAIGKKTNRYLQQYHITADLMPSKADSEKINEEYKDLKEKVYLIRGDHKPSVNIHNEEILVYTNKEVTIPNEENHYDYAFFTNASSVSRFKAQNNSTIDTFISIGKHTTKQIKTSYPISNIIEMSVPDKNQMVKTLLDSMKNRNM